MLEVMWVSNVALLKLVVLVSKNDDLTLFLDHINPDLYYFALFCSRWYSPPVPNCLTSNRVLTFRVFLRGLALLDAAVPFPVYICVVFCCPNALWTSNECPIMVVSCNKQSKSRTYSNTQILARRTSSCSYHLPLQVDDFQQHSPALSFTEHPYICV